MANALPRVGKRTSAAQSEWDEYMQGRRVANVRPSASRRGYDRRWRRFRESFLAQRPLCEDCGIEGRVTEAAEVHHIKKLADAPELKFDPQNCMALCKTCHNTRTARGE